MFSQRLAAAFQMQILQLKASKFVDFIASLAAQTLREPNFYSPTVRHLNKKLKNNWKYLKFYERIYGPTGRHLNKK